MTFLIRVLAAGHILWTPSGTSATSSPRTGRKPADYDVVAFQGIHARYVLVIIDEAGGVPKSIFDAVYALATKPRHVCLIA